MPRPHERGVQPVRRTGAHAIWGAHKSQGSFLPFCESSIICWIEADFGSRNNMNFKISVVQKGPWIKIKRTKVLFSLLLAAVTRKSFCTQLISDSVQLYCWPVLLATLLESWKVIPRVDCTLLKWGFAQYIYPFCWINKTEFCLNERWKKKREKKSRSK